MAYQPHLLLTFGGTLGTSDEDWQCGIRFIKRAGLIGPDPVTPNASDAGELLNDSVDKIADWWNNINVGVGSNAVLRWAKCAAIGGNGRYLFDTDPKVHDYDPGVPGQGSTRAYPFQVSKTLSFKTDRNRGRATNGRIYLPSPSNLVDTNTGLVSVDQAEVDHHAAFIRDLQTSGVDSQTTPAVVSSSSEEWALITRVRVGNVLDTQRRRRAQLTETYLQADV